MPSQPTPEASTPTTSTSPSVPSWSRPRPARRRFAERGRRRRADQARATIAELDSSRSPPTGRACRTIDRLPVAASASAARSPLRQALAVERGLPAEADDLAHVEARRRHRAGSGVALRPGPRPQSGPVGPPRREEHADPRVRERGRAIPQDGVDHLAVGIHTGGRGEVEETGQLGSEARHAPERGEHLVHGARTERRRPLPHLCEGDDEAGLVRVLGEQLHAPALVLLRRLVDPDAEPQLARHHRARADPRGDLFGEGPCRLRVDPRRQLGVGADERAHPRLGQGRASPPARRELGARPDELVAHDGVDCGRQGVRGAPLAGRGRIGDQASDARTIDRTRQRPPPGPGSTVLADGQARYEEAARDERAGHAVHLAVVVAIVERLIDGRWIDRAHGGAPSPVWTRSGRFGLDCSAMPSLNLLVRIT